MYGLPHASLLVWIAPSACLVPNQEHLVALSALMVPSLRHFWRVQADLLLLLLPVYLKNDEMKLFMLHNAPPPSLLLADWLVPKYLVHGPYIQIFSLFSFLFFFAGSDFLLPDVQVDFRFFQVSRLSCFLALSISHAHALSISSTSFFRTCWYCRKMAPTFSSRQEKGMWSPTSRCFVTDFRNKAAEAHIRRVSLIVIFISSFSFLICFVAHRGFCVVHFSMSFTFMSLLSTTCVSAVTQRHGDALFCRSFVMLSSSSFLSLSSSSFFDIREVLALSFLEKG